MTMIMQGCLLQVQATIGLRMRFFLNTGASRIRNGVPLAASKKPHYEIPPEPRSNRSATYMRRGHTE